jgi:hypothetical protein
MNPYDAIAHLTEQTRAQTLRDIHARLTQLQHQEHTP